MYDRKGLLALIKSEFQLDWQGVHGANHWSRVFHHGKMIGQARGADLLIVELFAFMHDSCRWNDSKDPKHGVRASEFAHGVHGDFFKLDGTQLDKLCFAMRFHSEGQMSTDPTIQTCWDSDRLDLGRVGIIPSSKFLSEEATKFIDIAFDLSIR